MEIKNMTDAELVEAVAREVLRRDVKFLVDAVLLGCECGYKKWNPLSDANDLFMVLEKHDKWEIVRTAVYTVNIWIAPGEIKQASSIFLPRAVLEAALMARIEK